MEVATILAIVIIGLLAVLAMLFIPAYSGAGSLQTYGTWEVERGRCKPKNLYCSEGGYREVIQRCIPNPETHQGCLAPGTHSKQTYETIISQEDCQIQCYSQRWYPIDTGECVNGVQKITYECQKNDPTGMNRCTNYEYIQYGTGVFPVLKEYNLGDTLVVENACNGSLPGPSGPSGSWVLVDRDVPLDVYVEADGAPIYNNILEYQPLSYCHAPDFLWESTTDLYVGCLAKDYVYVPSDQTHPKASECDDYIGIPNKSISCRWLPTFNDPVLNHLESLLLNNFGLIIQVNELGFITPRNLPSVYAKNPFPLNETFVNSPGLQVKLSDVPMMVYPLTSSDDPITREKITFQSSTYFYIVPQKKTSGPNIYRIVCFLGDGFRGYLKTDKKNTLYWEQGSRGPGLPGKLFSEAQPFLVYFNMIDKTTAQAHIYTIDGNPVNALKFGNENKLINITGTDFKIKFYSRHDSDNRTDYQYNIHHTLQHI